MYKYLVEWVILYSYDKFHIVPLTQVFYHWRFVFFSKVQFICKLCIAKLTGKGHTLLWTHLCFLRLNNCECFVRWTTSLRSLSSVYMFVGIKSGYIFECFATYTTTKRSPPVCIGLWALRLLCCVNALPPILQANSLSSVWICLWVLRMESCVNVLPHILQT